MEFTLISSDKIYFAQQPNRGNLVDINRSIEYTTTVNMGIVAKNDHHNPSNNKFAAMLRHSVSGTWSMYEMRDRVPMPMKVYRGPCEIRDWTIANIQITAEPLPSSKFVVAVFGRYSQNSPDSLLSRVCGGSKHIYVDLKLQLKLGKDETTVIGKGVPPPGKAGKSFYFRVDCIVEKTFMKAYRKWLPMRMVSTVPFCGKISMDIKLSAAAVSRILQVNIEEPVPKLWNLIREADKDDNAYVIAGNGAKIKCHAAYLSVHDAFKGPLERNSLVEFPNMSEDGVRALLAYLYSYEVIGALNSPAVALELFLAACEYAIWELWDIMRDLVLGKELEWWTPSFALGVIKLAWENKSDDTASNSLLEQKGLQALNVKQDSELYECPEFQELVQDENYAMEFGAYLISRLK